MPMDTTRQTMPEDQWAPLNYKTAMGSIVAALGVSGQWVPPSEQRRLISYGIYTSFKNNTAGKMLSTPDYEHRQYGDPAALNDMVVDGMLSDELGFGILGAAEAPKPPELTTAPLLNTLNGEAAEKLSRLHLDRHAALELAEVDRYEAALTHYDEAVEVLAWQNDWVKAEQVRSKIWETEREFAVPLGDGCMVLGWNEETGRASLTVYPAESYFPFIETDARKFPTKVHLVWEEPGDHGHSEWLHRMTYELVDIKDEAGNILTRSMPWGEQTQKTCRLTHRRWPVGSNGDWMKLDPAKSREVHAPKDLGFNFIPIIHIPNTPSSTFHYGRSLYANVAQLMDDLGAFDKDLAGAAALAATPMFAIEGGNLPQGYEVKAGAIWPLPPGAKPHKIDVSANIPGLLEYGESLDDRLMKNTRIGNANNSKTSAQASGYRVKLEMSGFTKMIAVMRLVRREKYALLLKMAQRISQIGGVLPAAPTIPATIHFGLAVPADVDTAIENVNALLKAGSISRVTAIKMLEQAGIPVGDVEEELARIIAEDFTGANEIGEATGSGESAAAYLGITAPVAPAIPNVNPAS